MKTRTLQAVLTLDSFSAPLLLNLLDPTSPLPIPSLLGRDMLSRFALYMEERTTMLVLLDPDEADAVGRHLP